MSYIESKSENRQRLVNVSVANVDFDVYIGREMANHPASIWGNPFKIGEDGTREEVIEKYRKWIATQPQLLRSLPLLYQKTLGCWCHPQPCHGDILTNLVNRWDNSKSYSGIGSRECPKPMMARIKEMAAFLATQGWTMRSGGADGADTAFEEGALEAGGAVEIYLPWEGFNKRNYEVKPIEDKDFRLAQSVHPAWGKLSDAARKLHARNVRQVFGANLNHPSRFLVCWTPDGCEAENTKSVETGGSGTAIALAQRSGIPVINLANDYSESNILDILELKKAPAKLDESRAQMDLF